VKLPHRVLFYFLGSVYTEQSIERGLTLNTPQNVFWW